MVLRGTARLRGSGRAGRAVASLIHTGHVGERDDRVLPTTRALCVAIVPFLLVAFVVLFIYPDDTDRLFAWTIKPRMTPMVLGSVYLGGAYFFVRAARATEWHRVKAGFLPVGTFATLMGAATVIHWDRFNHDHVAFWLWAGLYFTTPFLVFATWAINRRHDPGSIEGLELPLGARVAIGGIGVLALVTSSVLFLAPGRVIASWPWALTALTARVMGAILALGIGGLVVAADRRWSAAKIILEVLGLMLVLMIAAGFRSRGDLDVSEPLTGALFGGLGVTLLAAVALYVQMERRVRRPATPRAHDRTHLG